MKKQQVSVELGDMRWPQEKIKLFILNKLIASDCSGARLRDVKNEDRSGYVYENTEDDDKMSSEKHGFYKKMHQLRHNRQQPSGLFERRCMNYATNRSAIHTDMS